MKNTLASRFERFVGLKSTNTVSEEHGNRIYALIISSANKVTRSTAIVGHHCLQPLLQLFMSFPASVYDARMRAQSPKNRRAELTALAEYFSNPRLNVYSIPDGASCSRNIRSPNTVHFDSLYWAFFENLSHSAFASAGDAGFA